MLRFLWVSLLVIVLDQLSKLWVLNVFSTYERVEVLPVFNLTLVFNEGAAFSFLHDAGGWQRWLFIGLALLVSAVLVVWLARLPARERLEAWALSLVIGGALGNVIDRIRLGKVVDFLDFHWGQAHWPAFNLADSAITCGVVLLLFAGFVGSRGETKGS